MKLTRTLTILFFGMIALSSCGQKQATNTSPVTAKSLQDEKIESIKSDPLSVEKAAKMISNGLNEPFLESLAKRFSIGGYFDAKDFVISGKNKGIILWPCYNRGGGDGYPTFFLVAQQVKAFDSTDAPLKTNIPGKNLIMPLDLTKYLNADISQGAVKAEILSGKTVSTTPHYNPIDSTKALEFVRAFEKLMLDISPYKDSSLCKYGQYFFINNSYYQNFVAVEDLKFVHYYMGFIHDNDHKPNYYRPILTGVRENGTTIDKNNKARNGDPFLQKSVPPPPY